MNCRQNVRRMYRLLLLITFAFLVSGQSVIAAPQKKANVAFDQAYALVKKHFYDSDYKAALDQLDKLKKLIEGSLPKEPPPPLPAKSSEWPPYAKLAIGSEFLKVYYGDQKIYFLRPGGYSIRQRFIESLVTEYQGKALIKNRYLQVGDAVKKVEFSSRTPGIATIDEEGVLSVLKPGTAIIRVTVGALGVDIYFEAIEIPASDGVSQDELIAALGLPDKRNKQHIPWPDYDTIDGIMHCCGDTDVHGVTVEHWIYNKYPGVVLCWDSGSPGVEQISWDEFKLFSLMHDE